MPLMLGGTAITQQLSKSSSCVRWNCSKHSLVTYFHLAVFIPPQTFENIVLTSASLSLKCIKIFLHCSWFNFLIKSIQLVTCLNNPTPSDTSVHGEQSQLALHYSDVSSHTHSYQSCLLHHITCTAKNNTSQVTSNHLQRIRYILSSSKLKMNYRLAGQQRFFLIFAY